MLHVDLHPKCSDKAACPRPLLASQLRMGLACSHVGSSGFQVFICRCLTTSMRVLCRWRSKLVLLKRPLYCTDHCHLWPHSLRFLTSLIRVSCEWQSEHAVTIAFIALSSLTIVLCSLTTSHVCLLCRWRSEQVCTHQLCATSSSGATTPPHSALQGGWGGRVGGKKGACAAQIWERIWISSSHIILSVSSVIVINH